MDMKQLARLGAERRLQELERERAMIIRLLPGIAVPPRRTVSAAARKAMSAGMKRFWAKRKAAK